MEISGRTSKVTLYDDVLGRIRQLIQNGELKPGDKLPPERELAAQFGVSRNTLRESLKALSLIGMLDARQGGGNYISKDMNLQLISSSLKFVSVQELHEILNLLETRRALESATAYAAAKNATPRLIVNLRESTEELCKCIADPELSARYDAQFHMLIAEASGNPFLNELVKALKEPLMRVMEKTTAIYNLRPYTVIYHEALVDSMAKKDPETARRMMCEHLLKTEEEVKKHGIF